MALSDPRSLTMLSRTFPLIAGALAACSGIDGLPDLPRPDAVDAGVTVPLADSSDAADSTLPDASVADGGADGGADAARPDDAGPDSTVVDAAIDATIADAGPCVAEDNGAFCTRLAKNCGAVAANDNCGTARSVASCGTCSSYYESCGGGGQASVCGCLPESDWAFCTRTGNSCGSASGTDNCGNARTAPSCGGVCPADAGAADATVSDGGDGGSSCYGATCAANAICRPQSDAGSGGCNCNFAVTGLLGDGTFCEMPKEVEPIRYESYCVLTTGGRVGCWGDNSNGQLGTGDTLSRDSIAWIPSAQLPAIASLSGNPQIDRMCALTTGAHV